MRKFVIEPAHIEIRQGQNIVLDVSTADVQHGFKVEQLGVNEPIQPGKPVEIPIDTSKKGDFEVTCSIVCGVGHDDMRARIVIR